MVKTKEELNQLKQEYETLAAKLSELSEEELNQISSGVNIWDIAVKLKEDFKVEKHDQDTLNW